MRKILHILKPVVCCFAILTLLCGIIYPAVITGVANVCFPDKANGSIITVTTEDGSKKSYGSELIAQKFTKPEYLIGRPMEVSNLSTKSEEFLQKIDERKKWITSLDPDNEQDIPEILLTGSGSGVDPNITVEAAKYQVTRIARVRNISEEEVWKVIEKYTTNKFLGIFGEESVNVLKVNLALDGII